MQFGRVRRALGDSAIDLLAVLVQPGTPRPSRPPVRIRLPPEIAPHGCGGQAQLSGDAADRPALTLQFVDPFEPLDTTPSFRLMGLLAGRGRGRITRPGKDRCLGRRSILDGRRLGLKDRGFRGRLSRLHGHAFRGRLSRLHGRGFRDRLSRLHDHAFRGRLGLLQRLRDRPGLPLEEPLDRLAQVLQQMPTIGDLLGVRGRFGGGLDVVGPAVPADQFDTRMLFEPLLHRLGVAVGQEIHDVAPLQIHHDGAVTPPFAPGPIVDPDDAERGRGIVLDPLDAPQERVRTGRHGQTGGEAGTGLATEGIADRLVGLAEPGCGASVRLGEAREALGEEASGTLRLRA
jgi:hypothetical protein